MRRRLGCDSAATLRKTGWSRSRVCRRIALLAVRENRAGKAIGERRLADTLGPDDEPGVVHASAVQRIVKLTERRLMAEQAIDLARQ